METAEEIPCTKADILAYFKRHHPLVIELMRITEGDIEIDSDAMYDDRIDWNTQLVVVKGKGVLGQCDLMGEKL